MFRVDIIEYCKNCSNNYYVGNGLHCGLTGEKIDINRKLPDSCPLPAVTTLLTNEQLQKYEDRQ